MRKISFWSLLIIVFSLSGTLSAADYNLGAPINDSDDLRRQDDDFKKTREILEQSKEDVKSVDQLIRRDRYQEKVMRAQLKEEEFEAAQARQEAGKQLLGESSTLSNKSSLSDIIFFLFVKYGLYLLIIFCAWAFYYFGLQMPKRKQLEEEELSFGWPQSSLLAVVNHWRFTKEEYKIYQDKLVFLSGVEKPEIQLSEFQKHFVDDLASTEILFQEALIRKLNKENDFKARVSDYKFYLKKVLNDSAFLEVLNKYQAAFKPAVGQSVSYVTYYRDFLSLLMLLNQKDEKVLFELYAKFLLIDKLASLFEKGVSAPDRIQLEFDKIIDNFKKQNKVLLSK
ncbi:MAG: hypothetical protein M0Q96_02520 [Candidatus Omnitrophica bacterium]|jgi:hypothetical protein|nr:hypothetical protein [Candidatus Omnitrophota bacterium]